MPQQKIEKHAKKLSIYQQKETFLVVESTFVHYLFLFLSQTFLSRAQDLAVEHIYVYSARFLVNSKFY